jgi:hypothetical protein
MARNPRSVRFPPALEARVQEWADEHTMAFNRAIVELLGRALAVPATPASAPSSVEKQAIAEAAAGLRQQIHPVRDLEQKARDLASRDGKCTADAPPGTVCKLCGKKHGP